MNCAAIPPTLVESELFGHAKGAFTGRDQRPHGPVRPGQRRHHPPRRDRRDGDRACRPSSCVSSRTASFYPVGEETPTRIDVRILAATNRNLEREVAAGRFRADLYWRLDVIPVELPRLRERPTDIVRLTEHFLIRANESHRREVTGHRSAGHGRVQGVPLAGQHPRARERRRAAGDRQRPRRHRARRSSARDPHARDTDAGDGTAARLPEDGTDLRAMLEAVEERMIGEALERTGGNKNRAAELLGLTARPWSKSCAASASDLI